MDTDTNRHDAIGARYGAALGSYLNDPSEATLLEASDLGRLLLESGEGLLSVAATHHTSIARFGDLSGNKQNELAAAFLTEALSPALMTVLGFQSANDALTTLNKELEQRVSERTAVLEREVEVRQKAEQRFRGLLDATPDGLLITDKTGRILQTNQRLTAMFDYEADQLLGRSMKLLLPDRDQDRVTTLMRDIAGGMVGPTLGTGQELFAKRRGGSEFPIEISLSPTETSDGMAIIASVRDVSDRRAIEGQLRQAQKMEAVGTLTGGLAHDFNNLLGVIIGNLDLLSETIFDDDSNGLVREAIDAALRGADLTQRLLAFSRRQPLQPQQLDVNEIVERTGKLVRRTLGQNIEIRINADKNVRPIIADPAQLEASLLNIINNARDAMPEGGCLMITTGERFLDDAALVGRPELSSGNYTMIEVTDTGTGMPPEVSNQIFEPFFTTKEIGKGTGLGLSMVFGFLKQSGGHVYVYSEVGVGTTIRLYLPCLTTAEKVLEVEDAMRASELGGNETILVVEDDSSLRRIVARHLTQLGYRVLEAESVVDALKVLETAPVDLVFTDVIMPGGMSGYDLASNVANRWPKTRILLTSGFPDMKMSIDGARPTGAQLLTKPYRKGELARKVRQVFDA